MATGTGVLSSSAMTTGTSTAYRRVNVTSATFNESTGVTTVAYTVYTQVTAGNFQGSHFQNYNSNGNMGSTYTVNGTGTYSSASYTKTVAHNGSIHFYEGTKYTRSSGSTIKSLTDVYWYPTLKTYAVSYNANGGSGAPSAQTKTWGTNLTLSSTKPTRTGYTFKGWATSSANATAGTVAYAAGATYTANAAATLYAVWTPITYTVAFNANGGTGAPASQTKTYGTDLTLSSTKPTRTGYTFLGWSTSSSATTQTYAAGAKYTANAAATLYAVWRANAKITSMTVIRCDSSGNQQDDGTYAKCTVVWESTDSADTLSLTSAPTGGSATARTISPTTGGGTSTTSAISGFDVNTQYTWTATVKSGSTVLATRTAILTKAKFVLDFKAGGGAVGIGAPAPESGLEIGYTTKFIGSENVTLENGEASTDTWFKAERTDTGVAASVGVGSGGINHGVYSHKLNKWIVYADGSNVYINGVNVSSQTANKVLASPNGSTGAAAFRALVAADLPTVTVAKGGTGATSVAAAQKALLGWNQIVQTTGTTAATFDNLSTAGYKEVMVAAYYSTTYWGACILPIGLLHATTKRTVFLPGGNTSFTLASASATSTNGGNGRRAAANVTLASITPYQIWIDGTNVNGTWRIYAR